ncbi:hybrid sensor histidine kinase/response regulator transcription factor [Plebeiibacterium sediminum]|uniref:histidine kinase n=1 Tax=Plebeiibacterium sediminum TaxID=2992112 RepID=A0AAE3SEQ1_9BACT|nr:two-component regulator propeller domain-containing protein [Plebeiobacterium sediminum]MCW3786421.1 response regulator [Plebeiobacterium sediminum]
MEKIKLIFIALLLTYTGIILGNDSYKVTSIKQYLVEDGLSHNLINEIIQGNKGFIWLATYNGLCKFDGYSFTQYLPQPSDSILSKNNRIDKITQDKYGRIWTKSIIFNPKVTCFDPSTLKFWGKELLNKKSLRDFPLTKIIPTNSGPVWLLSETNGCICIADTNYTLIEFNKNEKNLNAQAVYNVHEDSDQNTWLLTNNGIIQFHHNNMNTPKCYFNIETNNSLSFFSCIEFDDEIWFGGSLGIIAKYSKAEGTFKTQKLPIDSDIFNLYLLKDHKILAASNQPEFCIINQFTTETELYNSKNININSINPLAVTNGSQFWFYNKNTNGIFQFDLQSKQFKNFPVNETSKDKLKNQTNPLVLTDKNGQVWVQPREGAFSFYDQELDQLIPLKPHLNTNSYNTFSNKFHAVIFDEQNNLWYNSYAAGLGEIVFSNNHFKSFQLKPNKNVISNDIRAIYQLKDSTILISNKKEQISILDKDLNYIGQLSMKGEITNNAFWTKSAYNFLEDSDNNIWIATRGDGIYKLVPKLKTRSYDVIHFLHNPNDLYSLSNNDVYSIYEDSNNRIWIGTLEGINLIDDSDDKVKFVNHNNKLNIPLSKGGKRIRCITETPTGLICVGSMEGFYILDPNTSDYKNIKWKSYENQLINNQGLVCNDIMDICITSKKEIFLATSYGGISKIDSVDHSGYPVSFTTYTKQNGLPSNNTLSLLEDVDGKIWISTDFQLSRFNPENETFEIFPEIKTLTNWNNFSEATKFRLNSGDILFGYSDGIIHFNPKNIETYQYTPYLSLANFKIFNQKGSYKNQTPILKDIDNLHQITLSHSENFFNIGYAALDYKDSKNIKYAYKLDGFDNYWNYVDKQRTAIYTNVPKGDYIFKVKSTNSQGVWTNNQRELPITVLPSFWESRWAYFLYTISILVILLTINYTLFTIYKLRSNINIEKKMSGLRQKFFIDISHEIRTPLTMITAPIEYLINDSNTPERVRNQLNYVAQSSSRMLRLVNQILDFRKVQELKLQVSEIEIGNYVKDICNDFVEIAHEQEISFSFENNAEGVKVWVDLNSLEKILMNLLSNAFKYTPQGKSIYVRVFNDEKSVTINVSDEGIGISKSVINKLFTRFVSFSNDENKPSTGIGLSILKEEADKHRAKVMVQSEPGKGSTFSVQFKTGKNHFAKDIEFLDHIPTKNLTPDLAQKQPLFDINQDGDNKNTVLIVEDDEELRSFIKNILEQSYDILLAEDGEIGFSIAVDKCPDFIISDIMMPKMNGIELLKKLRDDIKTSHIPIILLTAKTNIESKLEGLTYGADDYITKPFSVTYFKARIENLLLQRKRLHEIFTQGDKTKFIDFNPKPFLVTNKDEAIMEKLIQTIEENIDNTEFSIEDLAGEVGLNRTTMLNKVKGLTGKSPVEFVRDIRLKRSAQLITDTQLLIKEIAFMTGFQDLKYFGKCFKKKYEMTPMEYRRNNVNK